MSTSLSSVFSYVRKRLSTVEASALAAIGLVGASLWLFISIAGEVMEGETTAWDRRLLLALRSAADPAIPWGRRGCGKWRGTLPP